MCVCWNGAASAIATTSRFTAQWRKFSFSVFTMPCNSPVWSSSHRTAATLHNLLWLMSTGWECGDDGWMQFRDKRYKRENAATLDTSTTTRTTTTMGNMSRGIYAISLSNSILHSLTQSLTHWLLTTQLHFAVVPSSSFFAATVMTENWESEMMQNGI